MFDELKWRYEILLDMYRGKEVAMKKELEEYKNAHPLLPVPADDPNMSSANMYGFAIIVSMIKQS